MRVLLLATLLVCTAGAVQAQVEIYDSGGPLRPEQTAIDVTFYDIDLRIEPESRRIGGNVTTVVRIVEPIERLVIDLDTLLTVTGISEIERDAALALEWERRAGRLFIDLGGTRDPGEEIAVRVSYGGMPRVAPQAPWDGGFVWAETPGGQPWIATAVQGEGPDVWWPAKDHVSDKPDSVALHIRVPEPLVVATNGRLQRVETHTDGTRTFHTLVSTPISAYNVALNIAPYRRVESELQSVAGDAFPVVFYALPRDEAKARALLPEILEQLRFFERLLGPYPFRADGYSVAQTPHLGMEHQTVIAYGANFDPGAMTGGRDWGFDALHHHELAHEWWGNLVTNADWKDMWLHEGFGTYMQALYAEHLGGPELYRAYLATQRRGIANRAPVAPRESRTSGQIYFDSGSDIYSKGAWVLHTLRWVIGDDAFFEALRRMTYPDPSDERVTDGSHTRFATTDDFLLTAEAASGQELDWFFEAYLRTAELPRLVLDRSGGTLALRWQSPSAQPFPMPLDLEIDGERRRVPIPPDGLNLSVPPSATVVIDPDGRVLRENQSTPVLHAP
ncbi:MAG: M1 family metallopeptidase [Gemmatimonadota bacterium]